ncbi:unnamed protein product [Ixodes pacificus]
MPQNFSMSSGQQTYSERTNCDLSRESALLAAAEKKINGSMTWWAMKQPMRGSLLAQGRLCSWTGNSAATLSARRLLLTGSCQYCLLCSVFANALFFRRRCNFAPLSLEQAASSTWVVPLPTTSWSRFFGCHQESSFTR